MASHKQAAQSADPDDGWGSGPLIQPTDTVDGGVQPANGGGYGPTGLSLGSGSCADCK